MGVVVQAFCGLPQSAPFAVLSATIPNDFDICFQLTVLQSWPLIAFLLVTPFILTLARTEPRSKQRYDISSLPHVQVALLALLATLALTALLVTVGLSLPLPPAYVAITVLQCVTDLSLAALLHYHRRLTPSKSYWVVYARVIGWCHFYVLASFIATIFAAYSLFTQLHYQSQWNGRQFVDILYCLTHGTLVLVTVYTVAMLRTKRLRSQPSSTATVNTSLNQSLLDDSDDTVEEPWSEGDSDSEDDSDEYSKPHSLLSQLTFRWASLIIDTGYHRGHLDQSDIPPLAKIDSTVIIATRFATLWRKQCRSASEPSLLSTFWAITGRYWLLLGLLKFVSDCCVFIGPLLLNDLISFLTSQSTSDPEPLYHGYLFATALVGGVVVSAMLGTQYTYRSRRFSMRIRSMIVGLVYQKSLTISSLSKQAFSSGSVTNLMSVDTDRIQNVCTSFHDLWSLPLQIVIAMVLLERQVGVALFAGLGVVIVLIPINALLTKAIATVSRKLMAYKDERIALTNELLTQIRVIKFLTLEQRFTDSINEIRTKELRYLKIRKYLDAFCVYCWATTPILVALATFTMYSLMGATLTAARVFTSLALFQILIGPLNSFPWVVNGLVEGRVSFQRVSKYLMSKDKELIGNRGRSGSEIENDSMSVEIVGTFSYDSGSVSDSAVANGYQIPSKSVSCQSLSVSPIPNTPHSRASPATSPRSHKSNDRQVTAQHHHQRNKSSGEGWLRLEQDTEVPKSSVRADGHSTPFSNTSTPAQTPRQTNTPTSTAFRLDKLSLRINTGEFVGVVGKVGSGKTSLLLAMLGELTPSVNSHYTIRGRSAYVSQESWIQNATVRDNILFGSPYNPRRYQSVLEACALLPDLQSFPAGDSTEIGEGGINVSGGQRCRIALARAVYANADVYLLDDPLSAVDAHVAQHLIEHVVLGLLHLKTRVLVTHQTEYLRQSDKIVRMKNGHVKHVFATQRTDSASVDDERKFPSSSSMTLPAKAVRANGRHSRTMPRVLSTIVSPSKSRLSTTLVSEAMIKSVSFSDESKADDEPIQFTLDQSSILDDSANDSYDKDNVLDVRDGRVTVDESRQRGAIRRRVLTVYLDYVGWLLVAIVLLSMFLMQGSKNFNDWWLAHWADNESQSAIATNNSTSARIDPAHSFLASPLHSLLRVANSINVSENDSGNDSIYYLKFLAIIAAANSGFALFRAFIFAYAGLKGCQSLFDSLLARVINAPIAFFDSNPIGRILNRFSSDLYSIDENIPFQGNIFLAQTFLLFGALCVIAITSPLFLVLVPPLSIVYFFIQRRYRATSRELRRLDSVTRSPIYSMFGETLTGILTIRAFKATKRFQWNFLTLLDDNQRIFYQSLGSGLWLNVRLQLIGITIVLFLSFSAILLTMFPSSLPLLDVSLVGLALAYAFPLTDTLNNLIGSFTDTEKEIVSVERTVEYLEIEAEEKLTTTKKVPKQWPHSGGIEFREVTLVYRLGLQPALDSLSFTISPGEHVGIVGRTGSGKSSVLQALYRMRELSGGSIVIDSVDVSVVPLHTLRSRMSIIPQSPVLFTGTIRANIDIYDRHTDADIYNALRQCKMSDRIAGMVDGLDSVISENTNMFSVGEKQLLCFARALLARAKIIMFDEASASLDSVSDQHLASVTESLTGCTVIIIAHRLQTVLNMDRILVMDSARVVEFDTPSSLLARPDSAFRALLDKQRSSLAS